LLCIWITLLAFSESSSDRLQINLLVKGLAVMGCNTQIIDVEWFNCALIDVVTAVQFALLFVKVCLAVIL